jgi:DNA-binding NtrC family response regulator
MSDATESSRKEYRALIVEPDDELRDLVSSTLFGHIQNIREANDSQTALKLLDRDYYDIAFIHQDLIDGSGQRLSKTIRMIYPDTDVILLADKDNRENAAETADEDDVFDYVQLRPLQDVRQILRTTRHALKRRALLRDKSELRVIINGLQARLEEVFSHLEDAREVVSRTEPIQLRTDKPKILIVEDHPSDLKLARDTLIRQGYEVYGVSTGAEALKEIETRQFHLVLADITLPDTDGLSIAEKVLDNSKETPVIMITAHKKEEMIKRSLQIGASDYIVKPYNPRTLTEKVRKALLDSPTAREL